MAYATLLAWLQAFSFHGLHGPSGFVAASVIVAILGVAAGSLSTVAGMGGGIALVAILSLVLGPHVALTTTAPALLVGNVHRLHRFRASLDVPLLRSFAIGALPGSIVGAQIAVGLPPSALTIALVLVTLLALGRSYGAFVISPPKSAWIPVAFAAGAVAATSGAGVIVAPLLVAGGVSGAALIATGAAVAVVLHIGRIVGYGMGGLMGGVELSLSLALAVFLIAGNGLGTTLRERIGEVGCDRATKVTLLCSLGLALFTLMRSFIFG